MTEEKKICGIVMPISECEGRAASHWTDVKSIIESAAKAAGFESRLVSDTFESNLIHKEILQNIYKDDIIVCDVSARNPNVFFELGVRMATQLPTVIVKDDETPYPFDTGPNRYIEYPRSLRHPAMEKFKKELEKALQATVDHDKSKSFIGQLGPFQIPDVESTKLPASDIILKRLDRLEKRIVNVSNYSRNSSRPAMPHLEKSIIFESATASNWLVRTEGFAPEQVDNGVSDFLEKSSDLVSSVAIRQTGPNEISVQLEGHGLDSESVKRDFTDAIWAAIPF